MYGEQGATQIGVTRGVWVKAERTVDAQQKTAGLHIDHAARRQLRRKHVPNKAPGLHGDILALSTKK